MTALAARVRRPTDGRSRRVSLHEHCTSRCIHPASRVSAAQHASKRLPWHPPTRYVPQESLLPQGLTNLRCSPDELPDELMLANGQHETLPEEVLISNQPLSLRSMKRSIALTLIALFLGACGES